MHGVLSGGGAGGRREGDVPATRNLEVDSLVEDAPPGRSARFDADTGTRVNNGCAQKVSRFGPVHRSHRQRRWGSWKATCQENPSMHILCHTFALDLGGPGFNHLADGRYTMVLGSFPAQALDRKLGRRGFRRPPLKPFAMRPREQGVTGDGTRDAGNCGRGKLMLIAGRWISRLPRSKNERRPRRDRQTKWHPRIRRSISRRPTFPGQRSRRAGGGGATRKVAYASSHHHPSIAQPPTCSPENRNKPQWSGQPAGPRCMCWSQYLDTLISS